MAHRAGSDRGSAAGLEVLRHMGLDAVDAQVRHKISSVVTLVGIQRFLVGVLERTGHPQSCVPLRCPTGLGHLNYDY